MEYSIESIKLIESVLNESKKEVFDISKIRLTLSDFTNKAIKAFKHAAASVKSKVVKLKNKKNTLNEAVSNITKNVTIASSIEDFSNEIAKKIAEFYQDKYNAIGLDCDIKVSGNKVIFDFEMIVNDIYKYILKEESKSYSKLYQTMKNDKESAYEALYCKLVNRYVDSDIKALFNIAFASTELLTSDTIQNPGKNSYKSTYKFEDDFKNCVCSIIVESYYYDMKTSAKNEAAMILIEALNTLLNE